jgi:microcystin-dependent protein
VKGKVELATDAETQTGTDALRAITPSNLSARTATETRTGIVELATTAEAIAGTDTVRAVTPAGLKAAIDAALASFTPTDGFEAGDMVISGRSGKSGRWLLCQGAAVSRTTYADLFAQFGTAFGAGNGSTTFNLPDARSRVLMGAGQGTGLSNYPMGTRGGSETTSYSVPLLEHRHGSGANKKTGDSNVYGGTKATTTTANSMAGDQSSSTGWWTEYAGEAGASITVDRRQPYIAVGNLYARY